MDFDEKGYIRELAHKIIELSQGKKNKEILQRWINTNEKRPSDRPPIWCNPIAAWDELIPESELKCKNPIYRELEIYFRKLIIKNDVDDDTIIKGYYNSGIIFDCEPENIWGVDVGRHVPDQKNGAYGYKPPLKTMEDLSQLVIPRFSVNKERTMERFYFIGDAIGDIMPVKSYSTGVLNSPLGVYLGDYFGMTEMMMSMMLEPEIIHKLMAHFRDGVLSSLNQLEELNLFGPNNDQEMIASDAFNGDAGFDCKNMWHMTNSQEFDQVSPQMWEEFCLEYQKPIMARFGRVAYGCCENLTNKIDGVLSIPNLHIFVCSAWTDLSKVVGRIQDRYVIMWRQKASDVVFCDDLTQIKKHLTEGVRMLKGCHYQIILRELQTLNGNMNRLKEWTELAKEAVSAV